MVKGSIDLTKVTRFEVIDERGRVFSIRPCTIEFSIQDDSRTLKVFVKSLRKPRTLNDVKAGMKL